MGDAGLDRADERANVVGGVAGVRTRSCRRSATRAHWSVWFFIVFGAIVSSIVANAFMFRLVQKYEVSRTTPYLLMTPVITFTLAAFVLGDTITPNIIAGAATTMIGVALVALAERRFNPLRRARTRAAAEAPRRRRAHRAPPMGCVVWSSALAWIVARRAVTVEQRFA